MCTNTDKKVETSTEEQAIVPHVCGYCGSTQPLVSPEEMYGPGATGWPCCPDCGGV